MANDISTLPDRELDIWLAEHAMGWRWWPTRHNSEQRILAPTQEIADQVLAGQWIYHFAPLFSTDPAASYQLRMKMRELGWSYMIDAPEGKIRVLVCRFRTGDSASRARHATEMRAVAEACALALGWPNA